MHHPKSTKRHDASDGLRVFTSIDDLRYEARAQWVCRTRAGEWRANDLARGSHDTPIESGDRNLVTRFDNRVIRTSVKSGIHLLQESTGRLNARPVINEVANWDTGSE